MDPAEGLGHRLGGVVRPLDHLDLAADGREVDSSRDDAEQGLGSDLDYDALGGGPPQREEVLRDLPRERTPDGEIADVQEGSPLKTLQTVNSYQAMSKMPTTIFARKFFLRWK